MDPLLSDFVGEIEKKTTKNGHPVVILPIVTSSANKHGPPNNSRRRRRRGGCMHVNTHNVAKPTVQRCHYCTVCGFVSPNFDTISSHVHGEHNYNGQVNTADMSMVVKCEYCDATYADGSRLNKHRDTTHPRNGNPQVYVCALCLSFFKTYCRLRTHKLAHGKNVNVDQVKFYIPRFFSCEHCDLTFKHHKSMYYHRKRQHAVNALKATTAKSSTAIGKSATTAKSSTATGTPATTLTSSKLSCPVCHQLVFDERTAFVEHITGHTSGQAAAPVNHTVCNLCNDDYWQVDVLIRHLENHAHKDHTITCYTCCIAIPSVEGFCLHLRTTHCETAVKPKAEPAALVNDKLDVREIKFVPLPEDPNEYDSLIALDVKLEPLAVNPERFMEFDGMLDFLPQTSLEPQHPAVTLTSDIFSYPVYLYERAFGKRTAVVEPDAERTSGQAVVGPVDHTICNICNEDLWHAEFLERHLEIHELIDQTITCHVCCTGFMSVEEFDLHVRTAHCVTAVEPTAGRAAEPAAPVEEGLDAGKIQFEHLPKDPKEYDPLIALAVKPEPLAVNPELLAFHPEPLTTNEQSVIVGLCDIIQLSSQSSLKPRRASGNRRTALLSSEH